MYKAFGFITCVSMMAGSLYVFSGSDASQTLSAQTDVASEEDAAVARRFMQDARAQASVGNTTRARQLAAAAATLPVKWRKDEQTPQQLLSSLKQRLDSVAWSVPDEIDWSTIDTDEAETDSGVELQQVRATQNRPDAQDGRSILNRRRAEKLMEEAAHALDEGDVQMARVRAMQARQLNVAWRPWENTPDHILAAIDKAQGTTTFLADSKAKPAGETAATMNRQHAVDLLKQARTAIGTGNIELATRLTDQADALNLKYDAFDDTPERVRRDLQRITAVENAINFDEPAPADTDWASTIPEPAAQNDLGFDVAASDAPAAEPNDQAFALIAESAPPPSGQRNFTPCIPAESPAICRTSWVCRYCSHG